jgi:hypothetical protein
LRSAEPRPGAKRRMVKRLSLRPSRLGNPRRKPKGLSSSSPKGAEPRRQARSLDSNKHLATTVQEYFHLQETEEDKYDLLTLQQTTLLKTYSRIVDLLSLRKERLESILHNPTCERWLVRHPKSDIRLQKLYLRTLKKLNTRDAEHKRLRECQQQWYGFQATCCPTALAVPIHCNHRLCFYCNSHRSEKYRDRVRVMFDRLEHPVFLTLTIPNVSQISKRVYSSLRFAIRKLLKQHNGWITGGLYSLETTFNLNTRQWHAHAHVLIDSKTTLPRSRTAFIRFKKRLEYDWLLLTGGRKLGWRNADFDYWFHETESRRGSTDSHQWNRANRRIIDIRRVTNRQKAAYEVLKYITKASQFSDLAGAVDQFITAARGTRMIQTFGSWYGFKFPEAPKDWAHLKCECGQNHFEPIGILPRFGVERGTAGRWQPIKKLLKRERGST